MDAILEYFDTTPEKFVSHSRRLAHTMARHMFSYFMQAAGYTPKDVSVITRRSSASAYKSVGVAENWIETGRMVRVKAYAIATLIIEKQKSHLLIQSIKNAQS